MSEQIWIHNLSPYLFRFSSQTGIRWYGLAYLFGFIFAALIMTRQSRRNTEALKTVFVWEFLTFLVFGTMIGGRIGYAVFYNTRLLTSFSPEAPYWEIFNIWAGGMSSHGGLLGAVAACLFYSFVLNSRRDHTQSSLGKPSFWQLSDMAAIGCSVGIFLGRIANFMNGELFGRRAPSDAWYAVKFPKEMLLWLQQAAQSPFGATSIYGSGFTSGFTSGSRPMAEALLSSTIVSSVSETPQMTPYLQLLKLNSIAHSLSPESGIQFEMALKKIHTNPTATQTLKHLIEQIILAIEAGNEEIRRALGALLTPRYPSQLLEAALEGLLTFIVVLFVSRRNLKPGIVSAFWLMLYSLSRIFCEVFREPDPHLGAQWIGLTRGQYLSGISLFTSIFLLIWIRSNTPNQLKANSEK